MRRRSALGGHSHTILVVDDQEETLLSMEMLLQRQGHQILIASGGMQALSVFQPGQIHLAIVDYFMPGMTGDTLVERIREIDSDVQILLQTGYSGQKPPLEMLRSLDIQGYHDKTDGPDRLLLWVEVALKGYRHIRKMREVERLKAEILANVSHEFRTPIQVILGYAEVLCEDPNQGLPSGFRDILDRIHQQASRLFSLVTDFLAFTRSGSEPASRTLGQVRLQNHETECRKLMEDLLAEKQINFVWEVDADLAAVLGEPRQISIVLRNLLSNAAKFTSRGEVRLRAFENGDRVFLQVSDTGIGISPDHHETIFEPLRQLDGSLTRRFGGTGLGLALVRKLLETMGATISVESGLGTGATFTAAFRKSSVASAVEASVPPPTGAGGAGSAAEAA